MNILIINHYAGSPNMGMEFRPYYFAKEWIKMGHRVDILAADFSHLRRVNPTIGHDFHEDMIDGIHYHWIKTGSYNKNGVKRSMTMLRFLSKLWIHTKRIILEMEPDVVITSSTYPLDTYVGQRIKKLSSKKVNLIHEVHDMWPLTLYEVGGMSKKNPFVIVMQLGENSAYKHSDFVVSLPPFAKEYMMKHGLAENKFITIANGVVLEDWKSPMELPEEYTSFFNKLHANNKFIVGYFGGHALSNALDILVDCAEQSTDPDIVFVLVGDGVEKKNLQNRVQKLNLKNIYFLPPIDKKAIPSLCEQFDCSYIGAVNSPLYRFGLCVNKIYDTMMAGIPAVCSITAPTSPLQEYGCGIMVDSEDVQGILEAIEKIRNMSEEEYKNMGQRGRNAAIEHFDITKLAAKYADIF